MIVEVVVALLVLVVCTFLLRCIRVSQSCVVIYLLRRYAFKSRRGFRRMGPSSAAAGVYNGPDVAGGDDDLELGAIIDGSPDAKKGVDQPSAI